MSAFTYRCSQCGAEFAADEATYTCPKCGGNLDVILDYEALKPKAEALFAAPSNEASLWRYLPLLPVGDPHGEGTPLRRAGWTPVYTLPAIRESLSMPNFWLKDESPNPTASFKDRASAIVVARAREIGAEVVITASTGNAGAALAGMAAAVGQKAVILAPKSAPQAKIAQLLVFGARVVLVDGTYDDAFDMTVAAAEKYGWYCRNTGYNPFTAEGKKTAAFEIYEQVIRPNGLAKLNVFIPVGDGNIISGVYKGFWDLQQVGLIESLPRLFGVQAVGSAAIANAWKRGTDKIEPVSAHTLADSISVDLPRDGFRALRAVRNTGGAYITVPDEEILKAIADLGRTGVFAEPAAATAFAGLKAALKDGLISPDEPTLVLSTGSGLKDVAAAMKAVHAAPVVPPDVEELAKVLGE